MIKFCKNCGKEIFREGRNVKHCSDKCCAEYSLRTMKESYKKKMNEERICIICGKKYFPTIWTQKTCSRECSIKNKIQSSNRNRIKNKEEKIKKPRTINDIVDIATNIGRKVYISYNKEYGVKTYSFESATNT